MRTLRPDSISLVPFSDLDLDDPFFDSLRESYEGFDSWFARKAAEGEGVFVSFQDGMLTAMLYLKEESDTDDCVAPPLSGRRLKIGTFKVDFRHHTGLGKRLLSRALRRFAEGRYPYVYVTVFPDRPNTGGLCRLLGEYGFYRFGAKGDELVFRKDRPKPPLGGDSHAEYPFVDIGSGSKWILSILPEYHIDMFGDVNLRSEWGIPVEDSRSLNEIEKVYLSGSPNAQQLACGDRLVIYRTGDGKGPAEYRSVASSICTVSGVRHISEFHSFGDYIEYVEGRSVFSREELVGFWKSGKYPWVITFLYNFSLRRYPTRRALRENGLLPLGRIVCERIDDRTFSGILELGRADEGYVVN